MRPEPYAGPLIKPAKGSLLEERRARRARIEADEKAAKAAVVRRDGLHTCRLVPGCTEREKHETAHIADKGMGGDHGVRSTTGNMIRACLFHHRGQWSLHSGDLRVDCLTPLGADGAAEVWGKDSLGIWYLVKRETACGVTEKD